MVGIFYTYDFKMIQRIQNLYLVVAAVIASLLLITPIYRVELLSGEVLGTFGAHGMVSEELSGTAPFYIVFIVMILLCIAGVLLFKNRKKQLLVTRLNLILHIVVALAFLIYSLIGKDYLMDQVSSFDKSNLMLTHGYGYYLLFIGIPFLLLAIRGIRRDEELLRSIDRIR